MTVNRQSDAGLDRQSDAGLQKRSGWGGWSGHGGLLGGGSGRQFGAVAWAVDDELVSAVGEPVEGAVGEDGVSEETDPLGDVAVAGDDEAGVAVTLDDEGVKVFGLLLGEPVQTKVIDEEQVWGRAAISSSTSAIESVSTANGKTW